MNRVRTRVALVVALSVSLAIPSAALAASSTGSTPETLNIAATISMTVPASVAYTQGKALNSTDVTITNLDTDNQSGMNVTLSVNASGSMLIQPASRSLGATVVTGSWIGSSANAAPFTVGGASEQVTLATYSANNPSVHSFTFASKVNAASYVPGSYTGTLNFTASTN